MIIMKTDATQEQLDTIIKEVKRYGLRADISRGAFRKEPYEHMTIKVGNVIIGGKGRCNEKILGKPRSK